MNITADLKITDNGGVPVITVTGDLDHCSASTLRSMVTDIFDAGRSSLVVDMSNVVFMDSGGMSSIIYAMKRVIASSGRLCLAGCSPQICRKLEIGGLITFTSALFLCSTLEDAIQKVRN